MHFSTIQALTWSWVFVFPGLARAEIGNSEGINERGLPAEPSSITTLVSPGGYKIRYSEPGKQGVCETTPGVNSYSGYISTDAETNMFFWFFEARTNPNEAPITLWLEGGPGADSLFGLFDLVGPCHVTEDLVSELNGFSFTEVSNMLFLSQPIGVGFSYADEVVGILNETTGLPQESSTPDGRYADVNPLRTTTSATAAATAWEILQTSFAEIPTFDKQVQSRNFNLWTLSYGGHYGPAFLDYFSSQNELIESGQNIGVALEMQLLGIFNGIIDIQVQMPYYPEFAYRNQYGIQLVNETIYEFMKMAFSIPSGCSDYLQACYSLDVTTLKSQLICSAATNICHAMVEGPPESLSHRCPYDIREQSSANLEPEYFLDYVNTASVQNAIGVNLNYTSASSQQAAEGFSLSGDWAYSKLPEIEHLLNHGVNVALIHGDADYVANWFGGEAVSLAVNYTHSAEFRTSGYAPFILNNTEYGETRQYSNSSFTRLYDAGHDVPFYQPAAALEIFRRVLGNLAVSDGSMNVTATYETNGTTTAAHTESITGYYTGPS